MKVNTKIRYGLRTIIEIANSTESNGVLQKEIAKNQNISLKYLDSIISSLKLKGLIANSKGKGSGYRLTRPANEITMYDIYTAFEPITIIDCISNISFCANADCRAKSYWNEFKNDIIEILMKKKLDQILRENTSGCSYLQQSE
jgi:Rrf2 family transcriptional regulator, iron-sulfur cluster assembly transcription factor